MKRRYNADSKGNEFVDSIVESVWEKAKKMTGRDPNVLRFDACGAIILKCSYGCAGEFGWEIDHIEPLSKGGTDDIENLQPLHWANNRHKGNDFPDWTCFRK